MRLVERDFIEFLAAASGVPHENISFDDNRLMLIWPAPEREKERPEVETFRQEKRGLTAVYVEENGQFHFNRWPQ